MNMTQYKLYGREASGSFAVQAALEEIGAPYERIRIGSDTADVEAYRKINPTGKVPALGLPDGTVMAESAAILIYLALAHPAAGLAPPPGTERHARFLQWMVFLAANVYEAVLRVYYSARYSPRGEADAASIREQGLADYVAHLGIISPVLGPYVLGADYSIADAYLYMLAGWYPDGREALYVRLPALRKHAQMISSRSALVKAEADHAA
jgi:glutathione S-transferase